MAEAKTEEDNWQGLVILGKTLAGGRFRPSDWCDRLHGVMRALGDDEAAELAGMVHLINYEGDKAVLVDRRLKEANGQLFSFFSRFAADNQLQTVRVPRLS